MGEGRGCWGTLGRELSEGRRQQKKIPDTKADSWERLAGRCAQNSKHSCLVRGGPNTGYMQLKAQVPKVGGLQRDCKAIPSETLQATEAG